ncbi:MAG: DUF1624 domain-containing protein [Myxococcaceae bacterium]
MAKNGAVAQGSRLLAIDWLRGLVMVLMTLDHSSDAFNAGRLFTDSVRFDRQPLPVADFLTRWVSHICAPTFVFLAGVSLALSIASRTQQGDRPADIDRHIVVRGLIITAFEFWMSLVFGNQKVLILQVLYAIGMSMVCMAALRRLSGRWLLALGLVGWLVSEPLTAWALTEQGLLGQLATLLFSGGAVGHYVVVGYPLFPWLCTMMLGFAFGDWLLAQPAEGRAQRAARVLVPWGVGLLVLYLVLRYLNGVGNMGLYRHDGSLVQWLHVSKYPPSLAYWGLELGLAALLLALAFSAHLSWWPLVLLGQTALFYYLLHAHLLKLASLALGMHQKAGLLATYLAALLVVLVLLPVCRWYRGYKRAHPRGWPQYI